MRQKCASLLQLELYVNKKPELNNKEAPIPMVSVLVALFKLRPVPLHQPHSSYQR